MGEGRSFDLYLVALLLIGIAVFAAEASFVSKIQFIGTGDAANNHIEVADNLIKGNGFVLDYVGEFFLKFDSVAHPEEWGFPLVSITIAPFVFLFGKTAFAAKLPGMLIMAVFLPIATYFIGKEIFDRKIGFVAAVSVIFYYVTFPLGFNVERDPLLAVLLLSGFYFYLKGLKSENYFYAMGVFLGLAYLAKQTALVVFPALAIAHYLTNKTLPKKLIFGILLSALIASPWLLRNYLAFGSPLFSANSFEAYIGGYFPYYEPAHYAVYWESAKPSFGWLLNQVGYSGVYSKIMNGISYQGNFAIIGILAFLGIFLSSAKKPDAKIKYFAAGTIIVQLLVVFSSQAGILPVTRASQFLLAAAFAAMLAIAFFSFADTVASRTFALLWAALAIFLSFYWVAAPRSMLPIIPLMLIYSWFGMRSLLNIASGKYAFLQKIGAEKILAVLMIAFVLISLPATFGRLASGNSAFPYSDDENSRAIMGIAEKIGKLTPADAVVMGCRAEALHFHSGRKTVQIPSTDLATLQKVIEHYGVDYITFHECDRRFVSGQDSSAPTIGYWKTFIVSNGFTALYKVDKTEIEWNGQTITIPKLELVKPT